MNWTPVVLLLTALASLPAQGSAAAPQSGAQGSQEPVAAPNSGLDLVVLVGGERLEGAILVETDDYVEMRLDGGTVVGFGRDRVASLRRGVGTADAKAVIEGNARVVEDQWFVVHDGQGQAVGWLHTHAVVRSDQHTELKEEWEFTQDGLRTAVTMQETIDASGRAASCYYRERSFTTGDDRIRAERIVEARLRDDTLDVTRLTDTTRASRSYRMPAGGSFPLTARWQMRRGTLDAGVTQDRLAVALFDPGVEQFVVTSFRPGQRRLVAVGGEQREVTEVLAETGPVRNTEWVDESLHVLRREICGPTLVAVPSTAEVARDIASRSGDVRPPNYALEPGGRFGAWLPNPSWQFVEQPGDGRLSLTCSTHDAQVALLWLPDIQADPSMESAADTVERWHALLHPGFRPQSRVAGEVRGRTAIVLSGASGRADAPRTHRVYVIAHREAVLAITWACPKGQELALGEDLARILDTIDLDPKDAVVSALPVGR